MRHASVLRTSESIEQWALLIKTCPVSLGAERSDHARLWTGILRRDISSALTRYESREQRQLLYELLLGQVSAVKPKGMRHTLRLTCRVAGGSTIRGHSKSENGSACIPMNVPKESRYISCSAR
jgi:hypothetical protein